MSVTKLLTAKIIDKFIGGDRGIQYYYPTRYLTLDAEDEIFDIAVDISNYYKKYEKGQSIRIKVTYHTFADDEVEILED